MQLFETERCTVSHCLDIVTARATVLPTLPVDDVVTVVPTLPIVVAVHIKIQDHTK